MADEDNNNNDELVSQFLAFTGSADVDRAASYLEMSGGNLETAVGLFMEHGPGGIGGGSGGTDAGVAAAAAASPQIRAPDETRTMRLMDHGGPGGGPGGNMGGYNPLMGALMQANDEDLMDNHMASAFSRAVDPRASVNAAVAAAAADNNNDTNEETKTTGLDDLFAPPFHLMQTKGGFQGARAVAKDARRWLLVNIQQDNAFASHALNRDVWRDDLVENLVREGFIFYQTMDTTSEGRTYCERYSVFTFPHIAIIDPRTGRLMWRKEGWTMESPYTGQDFAEMAMDFCSRHSLDKPPSVPGVAKRDSSSTTSHKRKSVMSESEELQAAMQASLSNDTMNDEDDEVEYVGSASDDEEEEEQEPTFLETLLTTIVGEEPTANGARIQIRMPDAKRLVRKFAPEDTIKSIYAFVAQSNDEAKGGKEFTLTAFYPPKDLMEDLDKTVESCGLSGEAITVRWK